MKRPSCPWAEHPGLGISSLVLLGGLLAATLPCWAQGQPPGATFTADFESRTITDIQIIGNSRLSTSTILSVIRSRPGQPYRSSIVNQDVKSVQGLRGIEAVVVSVQDQPAELIVVFQVTEQQVVRSLEFAGNRRFPDEQLRGFLRINQGDFADSYLLARGAQGIAAHYREFGYHRVQVTPDTNLLSTRGQVIYQIVEGPRTRVREIVFDGNHQVSASRLRAQVGTKAHALNFSAGNLDTEQVEGDVARLSAYLRERGYLDARIGKRLDFSPDQAWVTVTFLVSEGALYEIRQVRFEGNKNLTTEELTAALKTGPGDVPVHTDITRTNTQQITEAYGRKGYVDAQVRFTPIYAKEQPGLIDLIYSIQEGLQYRVGRLDIFGNEITQDRVVRRQLLLAPNDIYDTTKMQRSKQRLLESMLFDQVDISDVPQEGAVRDVKIEVGERPTAMLLMGVGVTSDAGVVGDFSFIQRNFDLFNFPTFRGAGQYFRLQAQPGSELTRFSVDFREPYIADLPVSFAQSIYLRSRSRDDYDEDRLGGLWSLGWRFAPGWEVEGAVRLEQVTIRDIDDDTAAEIIAADGDHDLTSVQGTLVHDRTDSIFLPSKGDIFEILYEQFGAFGGDEDFGRLEARYACYFTVHTDSLERKSILALRTRVGTIFGDAPFYERYYAGGIGSARGFDFRGISPRVPSVISGNDVAVGSDWLVLAGAEYSFPLLGPNLRGAAFLDTVAIDEGPYRVSAGVSLRLMVPYFAPVPLSADFAWPLNKDNDDDLRVFSFSFATIFR